MKLVISIALFLIDIYMIYIIYNDRNGEKYECRKIYIIDFVYLWLGLVIVIIARVITKSTVYIDWIDFVVSNVITVTLAWLLFLKDFYFDIKKINKDVLPYNNEQIKQIRKTYIRNGIFLAFYIVQIIVLTKFF